MRGITLSTQFLSILSNSRPGENLTPRRQAAKGFLAGKNQTVRLRFLPSRLGGLA